MTAGDLLGCAAFCLGVCTVAGAAILLASMAIERRQRHRDERAVVPHLLAVDPDDRDTCLILLCDPCHDRDGDCLCPVKCNNPLCPAEDTGVLEFEDELRMLLDGER